MCAAKRLDMSECVIKSLAEIVNAKSVNQVSKLGKAMFLPVHNLFKQSAYAMPRVTDHLIECFNSELPMLIYLLRKTISVGQLGFRCKRIHYVMHDILTIIGMLIRMSKHGYETRAS